MKKWSKRTKRSIDSSLLGNLLTSKGEIQAGEDIIRAGERSIATSQGRGTIRAGEVFK